MAYTGWIWPIGIAVLVIAGFAATRWPRRRQRLEASRTAWSSARAAIDTAGISRDAAPVTVPEAEQLLLQAELIAARRRGAPTGSGERPPVTDRFLVWARWVALAIAVAAIAGLPARAAAEHPGQLCAVAVDRRHRRGRGRRTQQRHVPSVATMTAIGDVTGQLLALIAGLNDQPAPTSSTDPPRRAPTAAETRRVAAAARPVR